MSKGRAFYFQIGKMAEKRFYEAALEKGLEIKKSTLEEDRKLHVDFWMSFNGSGSWGVDVKGNNHPSEIWCEFKNVSGDHGWMYGEAEVIAFDMPEEGGFCVVDREDLKEYCEAEVSDISVDNKAEAYKNRYTRKGRSDVITKITLEDLKQIKSYRVWRYSV